MYSNKTTYINLVAMCFHSEETSFLRHIGVRLTEQEEYWWATIRARLQSHSNVAAALTAAVMIRGGLISVNHR